MKILLPVLLFILFISCQDKATVKDTKINFPSHNYTYVTLDTATLKYKETIYVPVFSDIYHLDGTKRFLLTTTVSIRNISRKESAYVINAVYNDSYGKQLRTFATTPILLKPLESIEFVIEDKEDKGGAGASFIVEWGGSKYANQMLIQAIMIGTTGQQGISFTSHGEIISRTEKK